MSNVRNKKFFLLNFPSGIYPLEVCPRAEISIINVSKYPDSDHAGVKN